MIKMTRYKLEYVLDANIYGNLTKNRHNNISLNCAVCGKPLKIGDKVLSKGHISGRRRLFHPKCAKQKNIWWKK